MTNREYVTQKLSGFGVTEAHIADLAAYGIDPEAEYLSGQSDAVGKALCGILVELVNAPRLRSVNENGFSETWDYADLSKYLVYLCRKYGYKLDDDTKQLLGLSTIIDRTSKW